MHALIMGAQAIYDPNETGHLVGDVPTLVIVVIVLGVLAPRKQGTA